MEFCEDVRYYTARQCCISTRPCGTGARFHVPPLDYIRLQVCVRPDRSPGEQRSEDQHGPAASGRRASEFVGCGGTGVRVSRVSSLNIYYILWRSAYSRHLWRSSRESVFLTVCPVARQRRRRRPPWLGNASRTPARGSLRTPPI
jgi:hypothetical protein